MKIVNPLPVLSLFLVMMSCQPPSDKTSTAKPVQILTLDPGHFHAALVQKTTYPEVDSVVRVYAPEGPDLQLHLGRITSYNTREKDPTNWNEQVYTGADFFEKMIADKKGNVVVLSGNNQKKTSYVLKSLESGLHVLADKPMVINANEFEMLKKSFDVAKQNNLLLFDIMTERFEITTILQREFSQLPDVFGTLEKGSPENPAITKESVHHFYKYVSGSVLTRPAWFLDVEQQGEGIVDVMTHLVDLVQWECFPNVALDFTADVKINSAKRWTTAMTAPEFNAITKLDAFPDYLKKNIVNDTLKIFCNGEINYQLKGVHAKTSVMWKYQAPEGTGDTHYSIMRGTKANLVIRQGAEEKFKPVLYIEPVSKGSLDEATLMQQLQSVQARYPGVEIAKLKNGWMVNIPEKYHEGHEAHFGRVMQKFLEYLNQKTLPEWEVPNMLTKYYTTTKALEVAVKK
jgi:predicted dehydrogenase